MRGNEKETLHTRQRAREILQRVTPPPSESNRPKTTLLSVVVARGPIFPIPPLPPSIMTTSKSKSTVCHMNVLNVKCPLRRDHATLARQNPPIRSRDPADFKVPQYYPHRVTYRVPYTSFSILRLSVFLTFVTVCVTLHEDDLFGASARIADSSRIHASATAIGSTNATCSWRARISFRTIYIAFHSPPLVGAHVVPRLYTQAWITIRRSVEKESLGHPSSRKMIKNAQDHRLISVRDCADGPAIRT